MYKIIYQKSNGEIIEKIRNTLPAYSVGDTTSMGWIILDIKRYIKNDYYSFMEYKKILRKETKKYKFFRKLKKYTRQAVLPTLILLLIPTYELLKIIM